MKSSKKLKLILQILICVLIIMVGIVGIYTKQGNMYKSILPQKYTLGSDISGITVIEFKPDESEETIYYDADGNEVDSSTVTEENKDKYTSENIPVNAKEVLIPENYEKSIKIMEDRLKLLGTDQYKIDLDKETGVISLSVEDDYIEDIQTILPMEASLKLVDSNTEDVIIDYNDFISAESTYASLAQEYRTYINLKLNDSGIEKINNIDKYKNAEPVKKEEKEDGKTQETEQKGNTLLVMFDSEKIAEVSYDDILLNGKTLRITTGKGLTSDTEINSQSNMDIMTSKLATIGKMPVIYNIAGSEFMRNDMQNSVNYIVIGLISICVIASLILIVKYKLKGLLSVLGFATNISMFLLAVKSTNIQISLNGFAGLFGLIILNMLLVNNILKAIKEDKVFSDNIKNAYLKTLDAIVVILIIFVVFAASSMTVINTMGLLLFWGWIITLLGTLIFTVPMLKVATKK